MSSSSNQPSEVFGPYLVYERLGVGGMAQVHRAKKRGIEGFERVCALKRMLPHLAEDADFVKSFVREAKLAAVLQHANISQIYELGRVGQTYFMAMEYVEGYDLRKILRQARRCAGLPPIEVVIAILGDLCDALDCAHNRTDGSTGEPLGIVHRDVSPSNLIVSHAGHLKVIDFGIAKATAKRLMTDTGRVKGKLGYMSPEAVRGASLDARSDMFSVGIVAHELLTARPLFASKSDLETLTKIRDGQVEPPSVRNQKVPAELDGLILRALAKSPDDRWPSAAAMRDAIHQVTVRYKLAATHRKVADWCRWAFDQTDDLNNTGPVAAWRPLTAPAIPSGESALPVAEADDEIIEIAWGGRNEGGPNSLVIGGVPDVSDQIPGPVADSTSYGAIKVVDDVATPAMIAAKSPPVPRRLNPRITFVTPTPTTDPMMATTPVPDLAPPPIPDSDITNVTRVLPVPQRHSSPPLALGTVPPARRTALGTAPPPGLGPGVTTLPDASAAEYLKVPRSETEKVPALRGPTRVPASPRARGFYYALAAGAIFGSVTAATAFFVRAGASDSAATPPLVFADREEAATPEPAAAPHKTVVTVRSTPEGLAVAIDDEYLARATPVTVDVDAGTHTISLADHGVVLWQDKFHAEAGRDHTFHPVLESGGTPFVAWNAVSQRSGKLPKLDRPAEIKAKLCIDEHGKVKTVELQKAPRKHSRRITRALSKWRYEPYHVNGKPTRVCFAVRLELD